MTSEGYHFEITLITGQIQKIVAKAGTLDDTQRYIDFITKKLTKSE